MEHQQHPQHYQQEPSFFEKNNLLIKAAIVGFLVIILLIPTALIMGLVNEREQRQQEVIQQISNKWAGSQNVTGPMLVIPVHSSGTDSQGKTQKITQQLYLLPEELKINGLLKPELRHRSIYDVSVYRSDLELEGHFNTDALKSIVNETDSIDWQNAYIVAGISDSRGLDENPGVTFNNLQHKMEPAIFTTAFMKETISAKTPVNAGKNNFRISLKLKGTGKLYFTPCGNTTVVNIKSQKGTPSFDGKYMPDKIKSLPDSGFEAAWKILHISRGYPQSWKGNINQSFEESSFGVKLIQEVDQYDKTQRSIKYAILIISLTFVVFFFIEILQKKRVHPLQYALVGFALCIFYTLLLSISEYTGFNTAYAIAATATIILIAQYIHQVFSRLKITMLFAGALSVLYAYIFFIIQLKDYSLLFGSIGLFVILAIIMRYSKNINWYHTSNER